jgi:CO/xanthine dehydrogenase Mo-binding subunit
LSSPIGQNVPRADGRDKVTGVGIYAGDMTLPGMLYGKVLRSPFAHAKIRRIDAARASKLPGVLAVLTRENLNVAERTYGPYVKDQPVVALDKVRYAGDVVAAVAAADERTAAAALKEIDVEYDELPAVTTFDDALREGAALVHERQEGRKSPEFGAGASHIVHENSNVCFHFRYERGELEAGFAAADHVFEDTFEFPSAQHYPMEPHVSLARFDGETLTVWSATQSPFPQRQELARIFGLPLGRVRVIVPYVGGGYGAKSGVKTEAIAAALSRIARRPVRVAYTSEETFRTLCQPRARMTIKTGVKKDGTFIARQCRLYLNGGAYANSGPSVTEKAGYRAHGPYPIPNVRTDAYTVYTNTVPAGAFRGFGAPQAAYAYDSHLEMIAGRLKLDSTAVRVKNLLGRGDEYASGDTPIDCDLRGAMKRVAAEMNASSAAAKPPSRRGRGVAAAVKDGGGTNKAAHAQVKILIDGSVVYSCGSVEIGQGMRTTFLQMVAEELTVPVESVQAAELDTQYTPFDKGTNASSATTVMGLAVQQAARDARAQLFAAAAAVFGVSADQVALQDGKLAAGGKTMPLREVMRRHFGAAEGEIVGRGYFKVPKNPAVPLGFPSPFWEIGFGAAEVEIDAETGQTRLAKYLSLTDAGRMINPQQCRGQDEGAAVFGIGQTFFEDLAYENGELMNGTLIDYRLPRFSDVPEDFATIILEEGGGRGPYGAKGMGEGGILAVAPAVCNAVADAIGVRMQKVPITPEKIWRAMKQTHGSKK